MKNVVFWDMTPCDSCYNRGLEGMNRLYHQGGSIQLLTSLARWFLLPDDGGDTFLRNVGSNESHMMSDPRRRLLDTVSRLESLIINLQFITTNQYSDWSNVFKDDLNYSRFMLKKWNCEDSPHESHFLLYVQAIRPHQTDIQSFILPQKV
jgi:hypothetical protein